MDTKGTKRGRKLWFFITLCAKNHKMVYGDFTKASICRKKIPVFGKWWKNLFVLSLIYTFACF